MLAHLRWWYVRFDMDILTSLCAGAFYILNGCHFAAECGLHGLTDSSILRIKIFVVISLDLHLLRYE